MIKTSFFVERCGETHFKVFRLLTSLLSFPALAPVFTVHTLHHDKDPMIIPFVGPRSNVTQIYCQNVMVFFCRFPGCMIK